MNGISDTYGMPRTDGCKGSRKREADSVRDNKVSEWMDIIAERKEEILEKVRRGETEPSIPLGAASFTYKQWNKLMKNVDRAIDDMQERIQEDEEKAEEAAKNAEKDSVTAEMLETLLGIEYDAEK